jgi:large subunit ribosomal protein L28
MSRRCELTAKGPLVGHKVSHSNTNAIKSVDHRGGLDAFLIKAKADVLSPRALELKKAIEKKVGKPVFVKKAG